MDQFMYGMSGSVFVNHDQCGGAAKDMENRRCH